MNEQELKKMMEYKSGSVRAFATEVEIPYTTIRSILERGVLNAKTENVFKICSALNIRPESFSVLLPTPSYAPDSLLSDLTDKVVQLTTPRQNNVLSYATAQLEEQLEESKVIDLHEEPLYTYDYYDQPASAGTGQYLNDVQVEQIELPVNIKADFVVPIYGDSMEPEYHSGDYIFVKLSVDLSDGDIGVFYYNGDAYIKQLVIDDQQAYLHSLNSDYPDIPITSETDFRIIGEVVDVYRERVGN